MIQHEVCLTYQKFLATPLIMESVAYIVMVLQVYYGTLCQLLCNSKTTVNSFRSSYLGTLYNCR